MECKLDGCNKQSKRTQNVCSMHSERHRLKGSYGTPYPLIEKHGMQSSVEYQAWNHMKDRCYNENYQSYHRYGARGITVCERWLHSFNNFYKDMGNRPLDKSSIDRINNDGNYEPSNCRWATTLEQAQNKSVFTNNKLGIMGVRKTGKRYASRLWRNGQSYWLGTFDTIQEASYARTVKEKILEQVRVLEEQ